MFIFNKTSLWAYNQLFFVASSQLSTDKAHVSRMPWMQKQTANPAQDEPKEVL